MNPTSIESFFAASPSIRLMRMTHAPFVLAFLNESFKNSQRIIICQTDLRNELANYLESVHAQHPEILRESPERYLTQWSDEGLLHRFLNADSVEAQYQLTRHTEDVLRFVDGAITKGGSFVGTESRLRMVIDSLTDLAQGTSTDPDERLRQLRTQQQRLQQQIEQLEAGGPVSVYQPVEIRERFQTATELLKTLQSDFRAVEENFRNIAMSVQRRAQDVGQSRGRILEFALDAEDLLKQQDQGVSFFSFVKFLFSPEQRDQFRDVLEQLESLDEIADQDEAKQLVRSMIPSLLAESEKVMRTTGRLSATLRRLLDTRATNRRRRVAGVIRDVRALALKLAEFKEDQEKISMVVESDLEMQSPHEKLFWKKPNTFLQPEPAQHVIDPDKSLDALLALTQMQRLDWEGMRMTIQQHLSAGDMLSLVDLIDCEEIDGGIVEVLGYIQIAHDDGHHIDRESVEQVRIGQRGDQPALMLTIPKVVFYAKPNKPR